MDITGHRIGTSLVRNQEVASSILARSTSHTNNLQGAVGGADSGSDAGDGPGTELRPVPSAPGYFASAAGQIFTTRGLGRPVVRPVQGPAPLRRLGDYTVRKGYRAAKLVIDGRQVFRYVHRLVAEAFLPPPTQGETEVRHLDGCADHNEAANLAWGSSKQNAGDRDRHGRTSRGASHSSALKRGARWAGRASAALAIALLAGSAPLADAADIRGNAPVQSLNLAGSAWMGVAPVEVDGELWAEFRFSMGASLPTASNGFNAEAASVDHKYFRLSVAEVEVLAAALEAWADAPHSTTLLSVSEPSMGLAFTGNAWNAQLQPVVVVQLTCWLTEGRGHIHGGQYMTLYGRQARSLAAALKAWAAEPTSSGMLFQRFAS